MSRLLTAALAAATLLVLPTGASAALQGTMGITGGTSFKLTTPFGDIDGDGFSDLGLSSISTTGELPQLQIVFGQAQHLNLDLGAASPRLVTVPQDQANPTFTGPAGDVNGDGTSDVLLTFAAAQGSAPTQAVIFGGPGIRTIRPDQLASRGFAILRGYATPVGDVNGDGRDDLLAQPMTTPGAPSRQALLLWGRTSRTAIDVANPGTAALAIGELPDAPGAATGTDVNGDRIDDLVVRRSYDSLSVIFGRTNWTPVSLTEPGARGYVVDGAYGDARPAGDVTGDGRQDLIVPTVGNSANIVPGQSGTGTLRNGDTPAAPGDSLYLDSVVDGSYGGGVAPVGDVTGDGRGDLVATDGNRVRLVAGRAAPATITLRTQPIVPGLPLGYAGIAPAGDVDGDGRPDVASFPPAQRLDGRPAADGGFVTLVTHGRDVFAPQFLANEFVPSGGVTLSPSSFRVGANATTIRASVSEDATAEVVVKRSSGAQVGRFSVPVTGVVAEGTWDGRVGGKALPAGSYVSTVTPVDPAGNRGPSRSVGFTIQP